jgi:hypothetical protein
MTAVKTGESMIIKDTATDQSGVAQNIAETSGTAVPAISDEDQGAYMEYIYMKQEKPTNAVGVPVSLEVTDANGNYRNIGFAISDASGFYNLA